MKKSKLRNKYLYERMNEVKSLYNKNKNLCLSILRKNKRDYYFGNLNNNIATDNRKLLKTISPVFFKKAFHRECLTLNKSTKAISNNEELAAETFNTFFR